MLSKAPGGILSWQILEDADAVAEKLDAQMEIIIDWRQKIYQYLTLSLENEEEAKGTESKAHIEQLIILLTSTQVMNMRHL